MQGEVTQKTVALSIQMAKLTADVLQKAVCKLLAAKKNKTHELHRGRQTMRHNTGVSNIEVTKDSIKAFESIAKSTKVRDRFHRGKGYMLADKGS